MIRSLWTAATGMKAQEMNISVISNNLANVNTTGFKKSRVDFQDLLYQTMREAGTPVASDNEVPTGIQAGHGVRTVSTLKLFTQGDYKETGNDLDIAIEGKGFFKILMPDGTYSYTRDGAFKLDSDGNMVTSDGFYLADRIQVTDDSITGISIGIDGNVKGILSDQVAPVDLGQIKLQTFVNPAGLKSIGRNLYVETSASGQANEGNPGQGKFGTLQQRYLEMSNVKMVEEMVNMIVAQRAYEVNSKAIKTSDEMLGISANLKR